MTLQSMRHSTFLVREALVERRVEGDGVVKSGGQGAVCGEEKRAGWGVADGDGGDRW